MEPEAPNERSSTASPSSSDADAISVEVEISGPIKFFHALSTFTSRPELLIPQIRSSDLDWNFVETNLRKCYRDQECQNLFEFMYSPIYNEGRCVTSGNFGEFSGSLNDDVIKHFLDPVGKIRFLKIRRYLNHKPLKETKIGRRFAVIEDWDFRNHSLKLEVEDGPSNFYPFGYMEAVYSTEQKVARITVKGLNQLYSAHVKTVVLPKLIEWMSDDYIVEPPKLTRLRPRPLTFVPNGDYWFYYDILKAAPAETIKQIWQESTDPVKFIHEDIGIASYISSFIYSPSNSYRRYNNSDKVDIIDLGCGNGLLCYFLSQLLTLFSKEATVTGYDIRSRRIWRDLLNLQKVNEDMKELLKESPGRLPCVDEVVKTEFKLEERAFVPHLMDDLIQGFGCTNDERKQKSLWIIGNHSDELTPWIPVVARRLNATGFFIIPCCPFDFFKKYQRIGNLPGSSIYQNYIEYICQVGDEFGYQPCLDKLRIPSTKSICLVGLDCSQRFEPGHLSARVETMITKLKDGDEGNPLSKFVPRKPESAKELPKTDYVAGRKIVDKIFSLLIQDWEKAPKDKWFSGEQTTFSEINSKLTQDERTVLKGNGNGLRTLIKSNGHLFSINGNLVNIRMPNDKDIGNVSEGSRDKIKSRVCYFYLNHPHGCPLPSELCRFKHESNDLS